MNEELLDFNLFETLISILFDFNELTILLSSSVSIRIKPKCG